MNKVTWQRSVFDPDVWLVKIKPSPSRFWYWHGEVRQSPTTGNWSWQLYFGNRDQGFCSDFETAKAELERAWAGYGSRGLRKEAQVNESTYWMESSDYEDGVSIFLVRGDEEDTQKVGWVGRNIDKTYHFVAFVSDNPAENPRGTCASLVLAKRLVEAAVKAEE